jgi:DNA-binding transcriptional MerR regulator
MTESVAKVQLPPIPAKRYFTIGEVSELCGVKPHVLRYWEQEFTQLKPVKRRGNRRYYQHHEVLLIRRIRELLYEQGFTISGARNRLDGQEHDVVDQPTVSAAQSKATESKADLLANTKSEYNFVKIKAELKEILDLLNPKVQLSLLNSK